MGESKEGDLMAKKRKETLRQKIIKKIRQKGAGKYYIKIGRILYDVDYKPRKYIAYKKLKKVV